MPSAEYQLGMVAAVVLAGTEHSNQTLQHTVASVEAELAEHQILTVLDRRAQPTLAAEVVADLQLAAQLVADPEATVALAWLY
jgi:hypothetical protein